MSSFRLAVAVVASLLAGGALAAEIPPTTVQCTLIADLDSGDVLVREGACDQRVSPMSTFKVPLAVMGFDAGILKGPHDPVWAIMSEYGPSKREMAFPEVDPTSWEKNSIVWYSKHIATLLGDGAFARYVAGFDYGNADVSGGLTKAWLMSSLVISPDEQVRFVRQMLRGALPVSARAVALTGEIIPVFPAGEWTVHGKTGSGWLRNKAGAIDRSRPLGWFVGWAENNDRRVVFARMMVAAQALDVPASFIVRDTLLDDLPALVGSR